MRVGMLADETAPPSPLTLTLTLTRVPSNW